MPRARRYPKFGLTKQRCSSSTRALHPAVIFPGDRRILQAGNSGREHAERGFLLGNPSARSAPVLSRLLNYPEIRVLMNSVCLLKIRSGRVRLGGHRSVRDRRGKSGARQPGRKSESAIHSSDRKAIKKKRAREKSNLSAGWERATRTWHSKLFSGKLFPPTGFFNCGTRRNNGQFAIWPFFFKINFATWDSGKGIFVPFPRRFSPS